MIFSDITLTGAEFAAACLRYEGLAFFPSGTMIVPRCESVAPGADAFKGYTSCYGFILAAMMDVGVLPAGTDYNLHTGWDYTSAARALLELIGPNAKRASVNCARVGDILVMRYRESAGADKEPLHHVGVCVAEGPLTMLHAGGRFYRQAGDVHREIIDPNQNPLEFKSLHMVWRLNNFKD